MIPNTQINLLADIPIHPDYMHTLYWNSVDNQRNYFLSKTVMQFTKQSYTRVNAGQLKIQCKFAQVYNCNYLMFQNVDYLNKWFYAFITNIEYVNENTVLVNYELDVIQSWYFDFTFKQCFIERQHAANDTIGANIIDEGLDTGDPYVRDILESPNFKNLSVLCMTTNSKTSGAKVQTTDGGDNSIDGFPSACFLLNLDAGASDKTASAIKEFVDKCTNEGTTDGIVTIYLAPAEWLSKTTAITVTTTPKGTASGDLSTEAFYTVNGDRTQRVQVVNKPYSDISGYVPRNNKMFVYPYNYLIVDSVTTSGQIFKYELFSTTACNFGEWCCILPPASGLTAPKNYNGSVDFDFSHSVPISNFPQIGYAVDSYKAWIAQNSNVLAYQRQNAGINSMLQTVNNGVQLGTSLAAGDIATAAESTWNEIQNQISYSQKIAGMEAQLRDRQLMPSVYHGTIKSDCLSMLAENTIRYIRMQIRPEYARAIDNYFTVFGYAVHALGTPNDHVRQNYTYIKTQGCKVQGKIPAKTAVQIQQIHDNGLTYWTNPANVGNYSVSNNPL